ncbi:ATP-binding protein [Paracoccus sp. SM22M-07]|uniref:ATP-binding protein n=1 Tax=Paracoccus sp. SM22M-07 TaxID=1520813 RepID=UPI000AAF93F7|nr:ATP-binding protein [Paracoccus sp. SM22M-07]
MARGSGLRLMRHGFGSRRARIGLGFFFLVIVTAFVGVLHFSRDMRDQIQALSTANSDSTQWFLAQSEVEMFALRNAVMALNADPDGDLEALRDRFDILYSRINTVEFGQNFARLRQEPAVAAALQSVKTMLVDAIPLIDGDDATLRAAVPDLLDRIEAVAPDLRTISLEGITHFSQTSDARRQTIVVTLDELAGIILLLFIVLAGGVLFLFVTVGSIIAQRDSIILARNRLNALFETSIDAIVVADHRGTIRNFNSAAERIYGYTRAEAIGADIRDLLTPPERLAAVEALLLRLRRGEPLPEENAGGLTQSRALHKAGHTIPVEVSVSFNDDRDGPLIVAYVRDVTRRVETEAELIAARDRALEGERAKARMIAVMNHEMRTPLNGILGTLDLMQHGAPSAEQSRYLTAMRHSADLLLHHVNDVLDASRTYNEQVQLNLTPFDPAATIRDLLDGLRASARQRGNELTFESFGQDDRLLLGDVGKIRQVVVNLVGNAIKFTQGGQITVQLDRIGRSGLIELQVGDTGTGIADQDLDRIFDEFVTLGSFFDRKAEGTGLGLAIVKRLVTAMNGEIDVVSELGEGSAFTIRLPLAIADETASIAAQDLTPATALAHHDGRHDDRRILLVEDNEINRLVAREMLKSYGCVVTEAVDGMAGVEAAQHHPFDLVLMDISMPRLNGVDAADRIRAGDGANAATPIIALTAHATPEDLARFRAAGMEDALIKPLDRVVLKALLDRHLARPAPLSRPRPASDLASLLGADAAADLLDRVRRELDDGLARLSEAPADMEPDDLARLAHKMAGSAAVIGQERMRVALTQLETGFRAARTPQSRETVRKDASLLRATTDCTKLHIRT